MPKNTDISSIFINLVEEPIFYLSPNFIILEINASAGKIFKLKKDDIIGNPFSAFCPDFEPDYPFDHNLTTQIGKKTLSWRFLFLKKQTNGVQFIVIGSVKNNFKLSLNLKFTNEMDGPTHEKIASQLLTEQLEDKSKNTLEHVRNIYRYMENIIAQIPVSVYWMNKNYVYLGCSNSMAQLLNLKSRHDIVGKSYADLYDQKSTSLYKKVDKTVMGKGISLSLEEPLYLPDGTKKIYLSNKVPLHNLDGKIIGMLGVSVDITDRKKMEEELRKAKEETEAANQAKDKFLANMSHDIRTPLAGIIGISALLEQQVQKIEEKEYAHWVQASGEQLLTLLNSMLDIVSMGDKKENYLKIESVSISQLLDNIVQLELPTIKLKSLELTIDVDKTVPPIIKTDAVKLHRVLLNLLGNAIKFTDKGYIALKVQYSPIHDKKGQLELFVSDTGHGISKDDQDKVFDRFFRSNPSYKGQYTGFGVGLHIVQQYVSMLKGTVSLESEVGQGTTFKVSIPVEIPANQNQTFPPILINQGYHFAYDNNINPITRNLSTISTSANSHTPTILLVEDNPIALKVVESLAQQAHCQYVSATTGEQALELIKFNQFDLILSDIGLPGISGYELASAIRKENNLTKKIPIIGLTAHAAHAAEHDALEAGMNQVISKPLTLPVLHAILAQFIFQKQKSLSSGTCTFMKDLPHAEAELFKLEQYPLLDVDNGLKTLGSIETLKELLALMLHTDLPKNLEAINQAYLEKHWDTVEHQAHKMKGGALYCGLVRMRYACQYLERYLKAGRSNLLNELYQQLMTVSEQTRNAISEWLDGIS